jgi:methanogenic corrinoid protein MtbC1
MDSVVLDLIQPVMQRVGDLWSAGQLSVGSEHFGTNIVRSTLADLLRRSPQPWRPYHILAECAPGEQHDIGVLILALFLRHVGFRLVYLGANLQGESLTADLRRIRPHAVCLSATTQGTADVLADLYETISATYHGILAYGGSAFEGGPGAHRRVPGLFLGSDVRQAADILTDALQEHRPYPS